MRSSERRCDQKNDGGRRRRKPHQLLRRSWGQYRRTLMNRRTRLSMSPRISPWRRLLLLLRPNLQWMNQQLNRLSRLPSLSRAVPILRRMTRRSHLLVCWMNQRERRLSLTYHPCRALQRRAKCGLLHRSETHLTTLSWTIHPHLRQGRPRNRVLLPHMPRNRQWHMFCKFNK